MVGSGGVGLWAGGIGVTFLFTLDNVASDGAFLPRLLSCYQNI
jgi:hypothetical protein